MLFFCLYPCLANGPPPFQELFLRGFCTIAHNMSYYESKGTQAPLEVSLKNNPSMVYYNKEKSLLELSARRWQITLEPVIQLECCNGATQLSCVSLLTCSNSIIHYISLHFRLLFCLLLSSLIYCIGIRFCGPITFSGIDQCCWGTW